MQARLQTETKLYAATTKVADHLVLRNRSMKWTIENPSQADSDSDEILATIIVPDDRPADQAEAVEEEPEPEV